ncbi:MAG: hypothetical protein ACIAXF_06765 [Phycisphaerales bacterium JB063]
MTEPSPYDAPIPIAKAWVTELATAVVLCAVVGLGLPYASRVALAYKINLPGLLRWTASWSTVWQVVAATVAILPWCILLACSPPRPACRTARRIYLGLAVATTTVALIYAATSFDPP